MENKPQKIDISSRIVLKTVVVILGLWFLFLVRDILMLLFISVIIVASIEPAVDYLQRKKFSRSVGTLLIYLALFSIVTLVAYFMIPSVGSQLQDFSRNLSEYFGTTDENDTTLSHFFQSDGINRIVDSMVRDIGGILSGLSQDIFSKTIGVFSGLISVIVVFSMAFYMSMEEDGIKKFIVSVVPDSKKQYAADLTRRIKNKIGKWLIGQFALMFIVFLMIFIGLSIIGVPYALMLAIFAGLLEIIPYIGPIVAAVPAVVVGFSISPTIGVMVLLLYILTQQIENHVIVPQIMKKAVGLNPVTTILSILVGFNLAGVLGAFVAVPMATAISLFVKDLMNEKG
jgi:predicted PurR-regulated permease PerM